MKKKFSLAVVLVGAASLVLAGIAPAYAAVAPALPAGQHMFALDTDAHDGQLWSVDSANGSSIPVGTTPAGAYPAYGAQVNPVDGTVYSIRYDDPAYALWTVDPLTGVQAQVGTFTGGDRSDSLAILNSGAAYVEYEGSLLTLNLSTGATSPVNITGLGVNPDVMAYNPTDDTIYGWYWASYTSPGLAYTLDPTTGIATADPSHDITYASYTIPGYPGTYDLGEARSAVFDGNGNPWFIFQGYNSEVFVQDFSTGEMTLKGEIFDQTSTLYPGNGSLGVSAFFITGVPDAAQSGAAGTTATALPYTGANTEVIGGLAAAATGLLSVGIIALIIVRRRHATR